MIQSMTGFGKVTADFPTKKVTVEVKTLNGKGFDVYMRLPNAYREKEMELRALLLQRLDRGKVEFNITEEYAGEGVSAEVNGRAIEQYYNQLQGISERLGIAPPTDWLSVMIKLPDVVKMGGSEMEEEEWKSILATVEKALRRLEDFRRQEGEMLEDLLKKKIACIGRLLKEVDVYESERVDRIKSRIGDHLEKIAAGDYDRNRFEQELIFYIEKLDVSEEKSRLANHLSYFIETIDKEQVQGRKLGFITQEIGREVNTLGSKSNHAEMQKIVVQMKDELEQIKEQVLNVL
ncbi:MAG: YicC family protein [Tannerellaceae bacterium]|nr:YicC family protein [Tannerellaceae bacterium]